jgi:uncharacterized protein YndB with AHSA1/START domain
MSKLQVTLNKETNELTMIREFEAPRELVWKAYTNAELMAQWWGPRAFTTTVPEMDVRPGGVWHYIMHGTGEALKGTEYEGMEAGGKAIYQEIKEPELLVYRDIFVDKDGNEDTNLPAAIITIRFEENDEKTLMTSTTKYASAEDMQKVVDMGVEQGTAETFDKLDELLQTLK